MFGLWVDDIRNPPGRARWLIVRNYSDAIRTLDVFWDEIIQVSLDHDLGKGSETGYDIATWIERQIEVAGRKPIPYMYCHSANPVGVQNIMAVFDKYNPHSA